MPVFWKQGCKGYVFTAEAVASLLCMCMMVGMLATMSFPSFNEVVAYKQASDVLEAAIKLGFVRAEAVDYSSFAAMMSAVGLGGELAVGNETFHFPGNGRGFSATVRRTVVSEDMSLVVVELKAHK